jgi:hypothetical protein
MSPRLYSSLFSRFTSNPARKRSPADSAALFIEALESRIAPASTAAAILHDPDTDASAESGVAAAAAAVQVSVTKGFPPDGNLLEAAGFPFNFVISRTGPATDTLTVNFTVGGTATLDVDYTKSGPGTFSATSGSVTFAPGSTFISVTINAIDDQVMEPDETVVLTLVPGAGYDIATPQAVVATIQDNDTAVEISVAPPTVAEDGSGNLIFTIHRTGALLSTGVTLNVGGTATLNSDFTQTGANNFLNGIAVVLFNSGQESATITIDPIAEGDVEGDETLTLTLSGGPYSIIGTGTATGTITNDDSQVSLSVVPDSVTEDGATT